MKTEDDKVIYCILDCRVSSAKQASEGESLDIQLGICRKIANDRTWEIAKEWALDFSGRTDTLVFKEQLEYIDKHPRLVSYYIFRAIDRFTRGGTFRYEEMRNELLKRGVEMIDSYGVIQPTKNTLEDLGFEYSWSKFRSSEITEVVLATTAKQEITNILTRMIGQEIRLTKEGYKIRRATDGFLNEKIEVGTKKKVIEVPDPERKKYFEAIFNLRASGTMKDQEIVDQVNAMGYKSCIFRVWNKNHSKIIGHTGGQPLIVKRLQEIVQRPIYCGVKIEKWTNFKPIRAKYPGLVSIEVFNKANRGKIFIKENEDDTLEVLYDYHPEKAVQRRMKNNPLFPYKNVVLCHICNKPLLGSSPRGKSGIGFPTYHCSRNHKYWGVKKVDFEKTFEKFIGRIKFKKEAVDSLRAVFLDRYHERQAEVMQAASSVGFNVAELEAKKAEAIRGYKLATTEFMKLEMEKEAENLNKQIKNAQGVRNKLEIKEQDIDYFVRRAKYIMEHPIELLKNPVNIKQQQALFSLVFDKFPNYEEIVNGTPKLTWVFHLSSDMITLESLTVRPVGIEPTTVCLRGSCS
ncbi:MAG: recombinase family protein, partial [Patescibacteria group bacterium]